MEQQPPRGDTQETEQQAGTLEPILVGLDADFEPESHDKSHLAENANPIDMPIGEYRAIESTGDPVDVEERRDDDQASR